MKRRVAAAYISLSPLLANAFISNAPCIGISIAPQKSITSREAENEANFLASNTFIDEGESHTRVIGRRDFVSKLILSTAVVSSLQHIPSASASDADTTTPPKEKEAKKEFDPRYFLAGGGCAAFSHGVATPFDVVKTKMQAEPEVFDSGFVDATTSLVKDNGPGVLLSGLVPTLVGFGLEGAVKFGVYEALKPTFMSILHTDDKFVPYLAASVGAGMIASLMLCPMERTRINMVTSGKKTGPVS